MSKQARREYRKEYWAFIRCYFRPHLMRLGTLLFILLGSISTQLYNPYLLRDFIDGATNGKSESALLLIAGLFIGIALLNQVLQTIITYLGEQVGWSATNTLRIDMASHYLSLDTVDQRRYTSGEIVQRIDGDVSILQNFFSHFFIKLIANMFIILGVLTLLFLQDWRIGITLTLFTIAALLLIERIRNLAEPYWLQERIINARFFGVIGEYFKGKEDARSNGGLEYAMSRFYEILGGWFPVLRKAQLFSYGMWMGSIFIFSLGSALVFGIGGYLYMTSVLTIGTLFMVFRFMDMLVNPIEKIREQLNDFQKANAAIFRVLELFRLKSSMEGRGAAFPDSGPICIEFKEVSFGYAEQDTVLRNISFKLERCQKLGLLGRSGSGKTSMARLLLRLYDPVSGLITFNGVDTRTINPRDLRKQIGFVTQDVKLLEATLRDNLTIYDSYITDEKLIEIIRELGMEKWYNALPNGLDTLLLGSGIDVSAGEAQLIALLRVFLADPGLVVLDEASSRLDRSTEQMIERAMEKLLENRTAVIIAHKLATIQRVDEIMIMENGMITEYGKREALAQNTGSRFYQLSCYGLVDGEVINL